MLIWFLCFFDLDAMAVIPGICVSESNREQWNPRRDENYPAHVCSCRYPQFSYDESAKSVFGWVVGWVTSRVLVLGSPAIALFEIWLRSAKSDGKTNQPSAGGARGRP